MREMLMIALCLVFALSAAVWTDQSVPASPTAPGCIHINSQSASCGQ
jgi:hypothetical protein